MDSLNEKASQMLEALQGVDLPDWESPRDLSRLSVAASMRAHGAGPDELLGSEGQVRLSGASVVKNATTFAAAGETMTTFQRLVTSIGAALDGSKSLFGKFAADIVSRTQISLIAEPSPGSVILHFAPTADPHDELFPDGQASLVGGERSLIDRSLVEVVQILMDAASSSADAEPLVRRLNQLGARVSSAVGSFAETVSTEGLDFDMVWHNPHGDTVRASLSRPTAAWVNEIVSGRHLDSEPTVLEGTVHTVSDVSNWVIDCGDELGVISVRASNLTPDEINAVRVGSRVRIDALAQPKVRPGIPPLIKYTAVSVEVLDS